MVDLSGDEEQVLSRMKQKTRYNIRLAAKKGVLVHPSTDLDTFHHLMRLPASETCLGCTAGIITSAPYELFQPRGECILLLAEYQGQPLSALMAFARGRRAWYFYGASGNAHRERMPTYLLAMGSHALGAGRVVASRTTCGACPISMKVTWKPIFPSAARVCGVFIASSAVLAVS